jgi:Tol biopolymer transport system component
LDQGQLERGLPGSEQEPRWSPAGNSILFRANGGVDTVAAGLGGGTPVTVISGALGPVASATWSPDGKRIGFVRRDSLMSYTIANGEVRFLAKLPGKECAWSPRNDWIACVDPRNYSAIGYSMGNIGPSAILLTPVEGGTPVPLTDNATMNASPVWSPDGRRLYFVSNRDGQRDIYYVAVGRDGRPDGEARRLTTALNAGALSLAGDGTRLAYSVYTPRANVWSVPILPNGVATSAMATQVTFGHQLVESMSVTPDGRTLFLDADRKGDSDIWRLEIGKDEPEAMTSDVADEFGGVLSPDGRRLAYYSYREGSSRGLIMVKPMDGGPVQQVNDSATYGIFPEWTPDSKALTWGCADAPRGGRCIATQDGAGRWRAEPKADTRANWSPDGRWSAQPRRGFWRALSDIDSLWIWPADGGAGKLLYVRRTATDPTVFELQWGGDSRFLFFRSRDPQGRSLFWSLSIEGGPPRLVARLDDPARPSYRSDFATDGRRIFFTLNDRQSDISVVELVAR